MNYTKCELGLILLFWKQPNGKFGGQNVSANVHVQAMAFDWIVNYSINQISVTEHLQKPIGAQDLLYLCNTVIAI